ncbi:prephenate dehydratase [Fulvivirgaceae bacterium BMA10]|uniref:Bifunctional chorismate mutase/prephenate dehydratase n=1 Tax=Splendidivirga corallicola TaxID=3051826 RepID=A0ABT8KUZ2_9BACT|nr:prephenate dehydratase [Fulvivirgaceae bacterium BMA10]
MELKELRTQIDQIDDRLLQLLNERMSLVKEVGKFKTKNKVLVYQPDREKAILDRLGDLNDGLLNEQAIEAIFLEIFAVSRNIELPERIAYLGPEGSFTHQAAENRFGSMSEYLPLGSIQAVFETVDTHRANYGVVPIENNQQGVVNETIDYLVGSDLKIVAEIPMSIHFSFATKSEKLRDITKIYSKDIAFRQCKKFIDDLYGKNQVELIPVNSTSKAVEIALQDSKSAAICSHIAARQYNLPILFENIEDSRDNQTRFLILGREIIKEKSKKDKSTILVKLTNSNEPGKLASFLQDFHQANINLTKIESRPAKKGKNFNYVFFIDFDGHFLDEHVSEVLEKHKKEITLLGSYIKLC